MEWTQEHDDFIREHPDLTIKQLVDALGHTYDATKLRRYKLCGSRDRPTMCKQSDEQYMQKHRLSLWGAQ